MTGRPTTELHTPMTLRSARPLLLALLLPLAACDETATLSATPEQAIEDASAARSRGDFPAAVSILERSLAENPDSAPLRSELASTLLQRDGLDLLDLDRIASYLSANTAGGAAPAPSAKGGSCAYADDPTATPFDPTGVEGYPEIAANRATAEAALALIAPFMPAALRPGTTDAAFCGSIDDSQSPVAFNYDDAAAAAQLRAAGLSDDQIGQALAVNALGNFTIAYLDVTEGLSQETTWYRLADGSIGICADDQDALADQARTPIADVLESMFSLDLRASTFSRGSAADDILEVVTEAFEDVRDGFGDYCDTI